ncbi:hypothetical protein MTBPR1_80145 [Candidatus Terasakiella magnetica]|uniref:Uncharacterized protein n=1 Tax=Candidatus Terasakiella magnetica TaxID=1867952 RepID=A0A1C3RLG5_9PROT|nr:hypothetical protein [Candidatus Terasakiella magnetica]SCA58091.1 hypothetical protein MTBPR1_80145 [Candidatus Terasakiella magnetica]
MTFSSFLYNTSLNPMVQAPEGWDLSLPHSTVLPNRAMSKAKVVLTCLTLLSLSSGPLLAEIRSPFKTAPAPLMENQVETQQSYGPLAPNGSGWLDRILRADSSAFDIASYEDYLLQNTAPAKAELSDLKVLTTLKTQQGQKESYSALIQIDEQKYTAFHGQPLTIGFTRYQVKIEETRVSLLHKGRTALQGSMWGE